MLIKETINAYGEIVIVENIDIWDFFCDIREAIKHGCAIIKNDDTYLTIKSQMYHYRYSEV